MPNYPYNPYQQTFMPSQQPAAYSQYQQPVYQTPPMPQMSYAAPQVKTNIKWVSGRGEAESTPIGPNETILMMDSSTTRMYIKSAGPDGRPNPLMVADYTISEANFQNESSQAAQIDTSQFATKDDFNQLKQMLEDLTKPGKHNG